MFVGACAAQWSTQQSNTTANLRGIHNVGGGIAWASGSNGTILRTGDGGYVWQTCTIPPDGEKLDFRGVWAWDANNAIVMSSGPAEQSRIYKTKDGCRTWEQVAVNSEKDGFWDAVVFLENGSDNTKDTHVGILIGDPVGGRFYTEEKISRHDWAVAPGCVAREGEAAFAASNSSVYLFGPHRYMIGTGGRSGPRVLISPAMAKTKDCLDVPVPLASGTDSAGIFSLGFRNAKHGIAVGGDYQKPSESSGTAVWTSDGGHHWTAASKPPHGYRSTVAWSPELKAWIAAGTNGSDISRNDGKTWQSLDDGDWNAISMPFVVGPKGRIAKLQSEALKH